MEAIEANLGGCGRVQDVIVHGRIGMRLDKLPRLMAVLYEDRRRPCDRDAPEPNGPELDGREEDEADSDARVEKGTADQEVHGHAQKEP